MEINAALPAHIKLYYPRTYNLEVSELSHEQQGSGHNRAVAGINTA